MRELKISDTIEYCGGAYTMEQFAAKFFKGNIDDAMSTTQTFVDKGRAKILGSETREEKVFNQVQKEEKLVARANAHDSEVEMAADYHARQKREGRMTYPKIEVPYPNSLKAQEHMDLFRRELRFKEDQIYITLNDGQVVMVVKDLTDAELNYIKRIYGADAAVSKAIGLVNSGFTAVTSGVGYTADKVIAPSMQIVTRASVSVGKTLFKTLFKTGASLVTAVAQGAKQTAYEVSNDADVLRAGRELIQTKDAVMRKVGSFNGGVNSSIKVYTDQ